MFHVSIAAIFYSFITVFSNIFLPPLLASARLVLISFEFHRSMLFAFIATYGESEQKKEKEQCVAAIGAAVPVRQPNYVRRCISFDVSLYLFHHSPLFLFRFFSSLVLFVCLWFLAIRMFAYIRHIERWQLRFIISGIINIYACIEITVSCLNSPFTVTTNANTMSSNSIR